MMQRKIEEAKREFDAQVQGLAARQKVFEEVQLQTSTLEQHLHDKESKLRQDEREIQAQLLAVDEEKQKADELQEEGRRRLDDVVAKEARMFEWQDELSQKQTILREEEDRQKQKLRQYEAEARSLKSDLEECQRRSEGLSRDREKLNELTRASLELKGRNESEHLELKKEKRMLDDERDFVRRETKRLTDMFQELETKEAEIRYV
jgi:hypothetical protein